MTFNDSFETMKLERDLETTREYSTVKTSICVVCSYHEAMMDATLNQITRFYHGKEIIGEGHKIFRIITTI